MSGSRLKLVLVTGISRGLGLAIAERLATDPDYRLIGLSRSLSDRYRALMEANPDRIAFRQLDVGDIDAIPGMVREAVSAYGPVYGMINNAGIGMGGVLATLHQTDIERVIRVNLLAPITFCKYASRSMFSRREGRLINISSIIASTGFHGLAAYAATKAGLEGLTRSLAREVGKMGITANCVAPGYIETEMTGRIKGAELEKIRRRTPLGLAQPEDIAGAVAWLLGPDGARVTGTVVTVDGGSTA